MSQLISVSDDVYSELKKRKGKESFSTLIRTLLAKKDNKESVLACFGKGGIDEDKINAINERWKKWSQKRA